MIGPNGSGVTAVLPADWTGDIGPDAVLHAQRNVLVARTEEPNIGCDPGYTTYLAVYMFEQYAGSPWPRPTARPAQFTERIGKTDPPEGGDQCFVTTQFVAFRDRGRTFSAQVSIGQDVPDSERQQAYQVLDSLRIASPD